MPSRYRSQTPGKEVEAALAAPPKSGHRNHDSLPATPLWCALVTRIVKPKSSEAECPAAKAAIRKELDSMREKRVWDVDDVYSLHDLLRTPDVKEAMLGRAFQI